MWVELGSFLVDLLIKHPQVAPLTALVALIAYSLRFGTIADMRDDFQLLRQKVEGISVIVYRIAQKDDDMSAQAVRDRLWDNGNSFPEDFDAEGNYIGDPDDLSANHPQGNTQKSD